MDVRDDTFSKMRQLLRYYRLRLEKRFSSIKGGKFMLYALLCVVCFSASVALDFVYYHTSVKEMDHARFEKELRSKEKLANQTLGQIKKVIEKNGLEKLYQDKILYENSESSQIAYHIYRGNQLLFWTSNEVALKGVEDFDFSREFFHQANNCHVIVLQTFCKEYRCVALIKLKDNLYPKKNSLNNYFAKSFQLPGTIIVSDDQTRGSPFFTETGEYLFSLVNTSVRNETPLFMILSNLFFILFCVTLVYMMDAILSYAYQNYEKKYKFVAMGVFFFLLITLLVISQVQVPNVWFSNPFLANMTFRSEHVPTISHLFLYTMFLYGIVFLFKRQVKLVKRKVSTKQVSGAKMFLKTFLWKLIPFVLMVHYFMIFKGVVYHSEINVAVSFIHEVGAETFVILLLELLLVYLYYFVIVNVRTIYAKKENVKNIVIIHLILTLLVVSVYAVMGAWMEILFVLLVSGIVLFVDLYEIYYPVNGFLYTAPIAFLFINLIVGMSYYYSSEKNEKNYRTVALEISENNCVYQDEVAESVLKDKSPFIVNDSRFIRWVRVNSSEMEDLLESYLWESYFKIFDEKYDFEIQICGPTDELYIRKPNFENAFYRDFSEIENKFRHLELSKFYVNSDEKLAISYLGRIQMDATTVYLKFYRKSTYDRVSLLEQSMRYEKTYDNYSTAKYLNGELSYSDGDFHYPILMSWIEPKSGEIDSKFELNYYTHYVHLFDNGKSVAVVSVPERQSYIYVIMTTYLFAAYMLVALFYFSFNEIRKSFHKKGTSLLTRMQMIFVAPILAAFLVLAIATFPFFLDQYEKSQFSEIKEKSISVQQNVQRMVGLEGNITKESSDLFLKIKELSNLFQLDIVLYDKDGRMMMSSRPMLMSSEKRQSNLVLPQIKFQNSPELLREETVRSFKCYSQYVRAYNLQNKCIGYIHFISHKAYVEVRNEMFNILVVVVDVYLFISIISIFIIWLLNRRTTKPLSLLSKQFTQVRLTGDNTLIDYPDDDEIGEVVAQYNNMVVKLQDSADKLARSEREFAWREMARRIAHEIKNPLTPMKLSVQQCMRKQSLDPEHFDEYFQKTAKILVDQIDNLSNIASEFSSFAKAAEARCVEMNVVDALQSTVALFANNSEEVDFSLELNGYQKVSVWMDDKQMLQVLNNLFRNAIQAIPSDRKGDVRVSLKTQDGYVVITVADNGCGISEANKERMFQPNFTTKTSGMGLGLAIVKNILISAGGDIWFESVENEGSEFFVKIPIYHSKESE